MEKKNSIFIFLLTQSGIQIINVNITKEIFPGGYRKRATPVPIPNTEVKPLIANGTAWVAVWESRTLPG